MDTLHLIIFCISKFISLKENVVFFLVPGYIKTNDLPPQGVVREPSQKASGLTEENTITSA